MTSLELANWAALYLATALCCAFAVVLSTAVLATQLSIDRPWRAVSTWGDATLLVPRTWWRWQKLYLLSSPVTLAIVGAFALSLRWG